MIDRVHYGLPEVIVAWDLKLVPCIWGARSIFQMPYNSDEEVIHRIQQNAKVSKNHSRPFPLPTLCQVVAGSACVRSEIEGVIEYDLISLSKDYDQSLPEQRLEKSIVQGFLDLIYQFRQKWPDLNQGRSLSPHLINWNANNLQLRVLCERASILGCQSSFLFNKSIPDSRIYGVRSPFYPNDLMELLTDGIWRNFNSLEDVAREFGLPHTHFLKTDEILDLWQHDRSAEIRKLGDFDAISTFLLGLRAFLEGSAISRKDYQRHICTLAEFLTHKKMEQGYEHLSDYLSDWTTLNEDPD